MMDYILGEDGKPSLWSEFHSLNVLDTNKLRSSWRDRRQLFRLRVCLTAKGRNYTSKFVRTKSMEVSLVETQISNCTPIG